MNPERLLNHLEKIYGKKPVERDTFNRREALPSEIKEQLDKGRSNGHGDSQEGKNGS